MAEAPKPITLPDGTKVPVGLPPGVDPAQAEAVVNYLQSNPEAAKAAFAQAQELMKDPVMAQQLVQAQIMQQSEEWRENVAKIGDDPELAAVFEEIKTQGPDALKKYWNNSELLSKISAKMRLQGQPSQPPKPVPADAVKTLHEAAKMGHVEATKKLIAEGHDINKQDARGISALGIAVGFNKLEVLEALVDAGADIEITDNQGNTPLHYAAGYGRMQAAEILLGKKANMNVQNAQCKKPIDAARMNGEVAMVEFLKSKE
eukprot:TRINITY_DN102887_c0_g1_i2.p1 TRINITY_DN102887_c0_g1~~TRINITY_DN102887_c0_g1_i2.p1  ORF type:complete len:260 (-),score=65.54 TRINITY_DN102887_c0_g1_i2:263-1042(-)